MPERLESEVGLLHKVCYLYLLGLLFDRHSAPV